MFSDQLNAPFVDQTRDHHIFPAVVRCQFWNLVFSCAYIFDLQEDCVHQSSVIEAAQIARKKSPGEQEQVVPASVPCPNLVLTQELQRLIEELRSHSPLFSEFVNPV